MPRKPIEEPAEQEIMVDAIQSAVREVGGLEQLHRAVCSNNALIEMLYHLTQDESLDSGDSDVNWMSIHDAIADARDRGAGLYSATSYLATAEREIAELRQANNAS